MDCSSPTPNARKYKVSSSYKCVICGAARCDWLDRRFHTFPRNPEISDQWAAVSGKKWIQNASVMVRRGKYVICSIHFDATDYLSISRLRLKPTAVPKLNCPVSLQQLRVQLKNNLGANAMVTDANTSAALPPQSCTTKVANKCDDNKTETSACSYCNKYFNNLEGVILHKNSCMKKPMKCRGCYESVTLCNMNDHNYHMTKTRGGAATQNTPAATIAMSCEDLPKIKPIQNSKCPDVLDQKCVMTRTADKTCASRSSDIHLENKVLQDFKELFYSKEDCDVVLNVKGQEFPAHKIILKARSPVLASTFRMDMKEKATGIVDIDDCNPSSFSDFLCFLYCGDLNLCQENVFNLFTVADKYLVQDLRTKCLEFMKNNLSVETFCDTISLGLQHIETGLIKLTTEFFLKNAPQIILTTKWQLFLAEYPIQSNELFVKLLCPTNAAG